MSTDHFDLGRLAQVSLLQYKNHVLKPFFLHELQKIPGRLAPGIDHRKNEKHKVGAWHEILGDGLVLIDHGVCAWRVNHVKIAQETDRQVTFR